MQLKPNAYRLQETVRGVETMSRFALAVLALAYDLAKAAYKL